MYFSFFDSSCIILSRSSFLVTSHGPRGVIEPPEGSWLSFAFSSASTPVACQKPLFIRQTVDSLLLLPVMYTLAPVSFVSFSIGQH